MLQDLEILEEIVKQSKAKFSVENPNFLSGSPVEWRHRMIHGPMEIFIHKDAIYVHERYKYMETWKHFH